MPSIIRVSLASPGRLELRFQPTLQMREAIKEIPGCRYSGNRSWLAPRDILPVLIDRFGERMIKMTPEVKRSLPTKRSLAAISRKLNLRPYQIEGVQFLTSRKDGAITSDAAGIGKTRQLIASALSTGSDRTLVVYPAKARGVWRTELAQTIGAKLHQCEGVKHRALVVEGQPAKALPKSGWVGCHYEILDAWSATLHKWNPQVVLMDEMHNVAGRRTLRTQALFEASHNAEYRWGATATPFRAAVRNFWSQIELVRPGAFGGNWGEEGSDWDGQYVGFSKWGQRYCEYQPGEHGGWDDSGAANLDELKLRLGDLLIRRERHDVLKDLPAYQRQLIEVDAGIPQREKYLKKAARLLPLAEQKQNRQEILEELAALVDGFKLPIAAQFAVEDVEEGEKTVLFTHYHASLRKLTSLLDTKVPLFVAPGEMSPAQREGIVEAFTAHEGGACLLANTLSTGEAVNLTAASRFNFTTLEWTVDELVQAESRGLRIGQTRGVLIRYFLCPQTIDTSMATSLFGREQVSSKLLGEDPQAVSMAADFKSAGYVDEASITIVATDRNIRDQVLENMLDSFEETQHNHAALLVGGQESDWLLEDDE